MLSKRDYISWSEISTWLNCQLQWSFRYRDQIPTGTPTIDQQMGTAVHAMLAIHYSVPPSFRSDSALHAQADKASSNLILEDNGLETRRDQLHMYAARIWKVWGQDEEMPEMAVESPVRVQIPWLDKAYLCIPDAYFINKAENWGIVMSHKTRLSALPDLHTLIRFHMQAPLEAWALRKLYGLDTVFIYYNALTPSKAEREGPVLFTEIEAEATEGWLHNATTQIGVVPPLHRGGPHCYQCEYRALHEALVVPGANPDEVKKLWRHND